MKPLFVIVAIMACVLSLVVGVESQKHKCSDLVSQGLMISENNGTVPDTHALEDAAYKCDRSSGLF